MHSALDHILCVEDESDIRAAAPMALKAGQEKSHAASEADFWH